ncbi:antitoxin VapB family protein [Natronomonas marina]|jgi:predicted CopG family antitoxin|uniref:antitoxin VapB family protein n=1 Tax=Natronomonas marina TaxID=2961939 RepID=UPI0020C9FA3A|nr:antitoxin VapB family protein [Natronomonas marina]
MASKNIGIKEDVYERLKAHKRGDESFSETLDRLLHELDSDWRTNAGFLSQQAAADLEAEVERGFEDLDDAFDERGDGIDERLSGES